MKNFSNFVIAILFLVFINASVQAQPREVSEKFRVETIDSLLQLLKDKYAYPKIALKMEEAVRNRQKRGEYDSISPSDKLAEKLTADLRTVFDDKHLKLSFSEKTIPVQSAKAGAPTPEEIEQARRRQRRENFGLQKIEILKGNVGLMQLNYFAPLDWSADVYRAAFGAFANTDALIIDVRRNSGSMDINTIPFFSSYLFDKPADEETTHAND